MSEDPQMIVRYSLRPTKRSSDHHVAPEGWEGHCRLSVRCGRQILGVYGKKEPVILLGYFAPDVLRLVGKTAVNRRADLELAYIRAGRDPSELAGAIVASPGTPLQLWCPRHPGGHDVDVGLLRSEVVKADSARIGSSWCPVERVVAAD